MYDLWVYYEQLGCGVILMSHDWISRLIPLLLSRWGNCPKFCRKFDDALIWQVVITKWLSI